jgi:PAS domain S-box-containing protein/diguanylate cyclase (GGDEF)-like protein
VNLVEVAGVLGFFKRSVADFIPSEMAEEARGEVMESAELYRSILDNIQEGVYFVDRDRKITFWNRGAERLTGYFREEIQGRKCHEGLLQHCTAGGEMLCHSGCPLAATILDGRLRHGRVFMRHHDGHRVPVWVRSSAIRHPGGQIIGAVEVFSRHSTNSAQLRRQREKVQEGQFDAATGMPDETVCRAALETNLLAVRKYGDLFAVVHLTLDRVGFIEERFGKGAIDAASKMVGQTLRNCLRLEDTVTVLQDGAFAVILKVSRREDIRPVVERLRVMVERSGFPWWGAIVEVTCSFGSAVLDASDSVDDVLARAESLSRKSRFLGGNRNILG